MVGIPNIPTEHCFRFEDKDYADLDLEQVRVIRCSKSTSSKLLGAGTSFNAAERNGTHPIGQTQVAAILKILFKVESFMRPLGHNHLTLFGPAYFGISGTLGGAHCAPLDHNDPSKPSHRLTNGPEPSKTIESDGSNIKKPS